MADDMTIDEVAAEYGVSRSTVERAINDGALRWHDGFNEDRRPVTMIEAEDALHWWNARKPRRRRRVRAMVDGRRAAVTILDADAAGDDDDDADADDGTDADAAAAAAGEDERAVAVAVADVVDQTLTAYTRAAWMAGYGQAERALRGVIADTRAELVDAERRAAVAEAALAQAHAQTRTDQQPARRGLWDRLAGWGHARRM